MTRDDAKLYLPVIQAFAEGEVIQICSNGIWQDRPFSSSIEFTLRPVRYRIKPVEEQAPAGLSLCSECETLRGDKIDLVVQVAELTGEVSRLKGLLDIRDDEIVLLKAQVAEARAGHDEALEMREQAFTEREAACDDASFVRSVNTKLLTENSALKASGWRQFKDQRPTMDDADADGDVNILGADGVLANVHVFHAGGLDTAWWRPTASPITLSPFGRWMQALTPSERDRFDSNGSLTAIWNSIEKFNQKQNPGDPAKPPTRPAGEGVIIHQLPSQGGSPRHS